MRETIMSCAEYAQKFPRTFPVENNYRNVEDAEAFSKNRGEVAVTDEYHQYIPPQSARTYPRFDNVRTFLWSKSKAA